MTLKLRLTLLLAAFVGLSACAPKNWQHEEDGPFDPLEPFNRQTYKLNKGLDWLIIRPLGVAYRSAPPPFKNIVSNVLDNAAEPANIVNNALQKKGKASINSISRLVFNTTFGLGGAFDMADKMGIEEEKADFGQTLRAYGLTDTMYFVLPVLGPTTAADSVGQVGDAGLYPVNYMEHDAARTGIGVVSGARRRADLLDTTDLVEEIALDEYTFVRDAYEDSRRAIVPTDIWGNRE